MKRIVLFVLLLTLGVVVAASNSSAQNGMVSIDKVENTQYTDGTFQDGVPPRVLIRYNNTTTEKQNISNGWIITSYDGAQWDSVTMDSAGPITIDLENRFALYFNQVYEFWSGPLEAAEGVDPDTVGILGAGNPGSTTRQMPVGYNDTAMAIIIWLNPADDNHNKHICIDSAFWGAGGSWKWVGPALIDWFPEWSTSIAGQTYRVGTGTEGTRNGWGFCFLVKDPTVGVDDIEGNLPREFSVSQNYPNPFNPTTTIDYSVPRKSQVNLSVYNVLGQKVATLVNQEMAAGKYRAVWDGKADSGNPLSSGIYFYKFEADNFVKTTKMVMLK